MNSYITITTVYCVVCAIFMRNLWAARKQIAELKQESRFLKSENARLEKAAKKEPSTVEAVAALIVRCADCDECSRNKKDLFVFCRSCLYKSPSSWLYNLKGSPGKDAQELGAAVDAKVTEYMEAQS